MLRLVKSPEQVSVALLNRRTWAVSLWQFFFRPRRTISLEPDKSSQHIDLGIGDMRDKQGRNLFILKDELMAEVARVLLSDIDMPRICKRLGPEFPVEHVVMHLMRRVNTDLYVEFGRYCMLVELGSREPVSIILIERSVYSAAIEVVLGRESDVRVVGLTPLPLRDIREVFASIAQCVKASLSAFATLKARKSPAIAVQYVRGISDSVRSDLAWLPHSELGLENIVLYSDSKNSSAEVQVENLGNWRPAGFEYWKTLLILVFRVFRIGLSAAAGPLKSRLWLVSSLLLLVRGYARWSAFFDLHNIKMHHHISDTDSLLVSKLLALHSRHGLDLSFQFSASAWMLPMNSRPTYQHQFMAWGPAFAEMIERCSQAVSFKRPDLFVFTGHPYHGLMKEQTANIADNIAELRKAGCRKIILILDSQPFRDFFITESSNNLFYNSVLRVALADEEVGLVLKPQYEANIGPEQASLIATLDRRVCRLDASVHPFQVFPHVDMAVGLGAHNTAIVEAAIAGVDHVFYDVTDYKAHLFYERIRGAIVTTAQELRRAMTNGSGYKHNPKWLDAYCDQRGHERMGRIIGVAYEAFRRGGTATDAVSDIQKKLSASVSMSSSVSTIDNATAAALRH